MMALEIIYIEYNTFLDCVRRNEEIENNLQLTLLETANDNGYTPLFAAAQMGNIQVLHELLQCGVAMGYSETTRTTGSLVFHAAQFGQDQVIEFIMGYYQANNALRSVPPLSVSWPKSLADLMNFPNKDGMTPLMTAAQQGHVSTVNLLLTYNALVHSRNKVGMTPLMFASRRGNVQICRNLIQHGAHVNAKTERSSTALFLACKCGHIDVVKELVIAGCYLHYKDHALRTAQQVVLQRIQRRRDFPTRVSVIYSSVLREGDEVESATNVSVRTLSTDEKMLFLLNPQTQVELMQFVVRAKRNLEIIRCYTLLQNNRADIQLSKGFAYNISTAIEWMTRNLATIYCSVSNPTILVAPSMESPHEQQDPPLPNLLVKFTRSSTQMLVRTMLLPAPIIQMIALFLPLPTLWEERLGLLELRNIHDSPNEAIVGALDMLDSYRHAIPQKYQHRIHTALGMIGNKAPNEV